PAQGQHEAGDDKGAGVGPHRVEEDLAEVGQPRQAVLQVHAQGQDQVDPKEGDKGDDEGRQIHRRDLPGVKRSPRPEGRKSRTSTTMAKVIRVRNSNGTPAQALARVMPTFSPRPTTYPPRMVAAASRRKRSAPRAGWMLA